MSEIFVVLDLETSGLDKNKDVVLEIGALHIDMKKLNVLSRFQLVAGMSRIDLGAVSMVPYVYDMHTENGLIEEIINSPTRCSQHAMDHWLSAWFMAIGARQGLRTIVLCGNSIHFDRGFIEERLPAAAEFLHHRMVDTSAMRTVFKQWCGDPVKEDMKHRALDDCSASLNTLRWQWMITVAGNKVVERGEDSPGARAHAALKEAVVLAITDEWDVEKFLDQSATYFLRSEGYKSAGLSAHNHLNSAARYADKAGWDLAKFQDQGAAYFIAQTPEGVLAAEAEASAVQLQTQTQGTKAAEVFAGGWSDGDVACFEGDAHEFQNDAAALATQAEFTEKFAEQAKREAEIEAGLADEELNPWAVRLKRKQAEDLHVVDHVRPRDVGVEADASRPAGLIAADISEFEAGLAHEKAVNAEVASLIAAGRGTSL